MSISDFSVIENNHLFLPKISHKSYVKDPNVANREERHIVLEGKRKIVELKMLLMRKSTTSLTLFLHSAKISLSLQLMTPRNMRTYIMITTKLSLLDEVI
jgi:hypothetical protein